jgi:MFS family permease
MSSISHQSEKAVLRALAAAMAVQFAIGGAILPFVSMILQERGLGFRQISTIFTASSSTLLVFPFLWGMLADRFISLNRLFIWMNLLALTALALFFGQSAFGGLLLSFMMFQACFNPTLMLINPLCFHHLRNPREQFGLVRAWGSLGWMVPSLPIYLWLAYGRSENLDVVLLLGMGLCLAMAVTAWWLPHTAPGAAKSDLLDAPKAGYWPAVRQLLRNPNYLTVLVSFFLMAGSFSLYVYYSPPRLVKLGLDRAWIGPVQCIGVTVEVILFRWRSLFVHRLRYAVTISIGCLSLMLRHLLMATVDNLWVLGASYLLAGMVIVFYHIGASLLVNTIAGPEVRSTAQTLLLLGGSGMGPMFANFVAGRLTGPQENDLRPVFWLAAGLAGLAGLLILWRGSRLDHR